MPNFTVSLLPSPSLPHLLQLPIQPLLLNYSFLISPTCECQFVKRRFGVKPSLRATPSSTATILSLPIDGGTEKLESDWRAGRQVKDFIDKIRELPSKDETYILSVFEKDGILGTIFQFNDLLEALVIAEESDLALKLFSNISYYRLMPDTRTFSILIRCYCKKDNPEEAKTVLDHMVENGVYPSVVTITILIDAFCRRGRLQKAFEVYELMGNEIGYKPTIHTYNCLMKGLCYVGRVEEAVDMLAKVKQDCLEPDIYTYTALMDGLCKVGRSDEAMELLNEAQEKGLTPNVITFNTLFNGYCKEGRPLDGIGVLNQMKEMNCKPDYISYSTLLHGLLKWGKIRTALGTYMEMVSVGYEVDERMMNSFIRALCRQSSAGQKYKYLLGDAHQVFEKMKCKKYVIDLNTYELVIQTLCTGKKINEALANLIHMLERGYFPSVITFNSVINELNRQGRWLIACHIYGAALKRGLLQSL